MKAIDVPIGCAYTLTGSREIFVRIDASNFVNKHHVMCLKLSSMIVYYTPDSCEVTLIDKEEEDNA